jgi:hypothetical protein
MIADMPALPTLPAPHASPRRARRLPAWAIALGLLLALLLVAAAVLAAWAIDALPVAPISISIDGEQVLQGIDLAQLPPAHKVVLVAVLLCALLATLVIVPVALVAALGALALVLLLVVGLPLLMAGMLLALLLSPLLLVGWLVWKLAT